MTITIGRWEFEIGVRKVRPLVGGNLDVQRELAESYGKMRRQRRGKRAPAQ